MPASADKILVGYGKVEVSAYVTAAGAGTFTDHGHESGGVQFQIDDEILDLGSDRTAYMLRSVTHGRRVKLITTHMQAEVDLIQRVLRMAAGDKTGTTPNFTLLFNEPTEVYFQVKCTTKGTGTNSVRTITGWKVRPKLNGALEMKKDSATMVPVEWEFMLDESVTAGTNGSVGRMTES